MSESSSPLTTTPVSSDQRAEPLSPMEISAPVTKRVLEIPAFARNLTEPLPLDEDLTHLPRKPRPLSRDVLNIPRSESIKRAIIHHSNEHGYYLIHNLSSKFTDASLRAFLGIQTAGIIRFRVLSVNENRGRFDPPLIPQQYISLPGSGIVKAPLARELAYMVAYAQKSTFEHIQGVSSFQEHVLGSIYQFLSKHYIPPAGADSASIGAAKFGGGIGRKSAAGQSGRFIIRARAGLITDEEWRQRGAAGVESNGVYTVAKFSRIEIRDAACDSFIVGIELGGHGKGFEVGISAICNETVVIENTEASLDATRYLDMEIFWPQVFSQPIFRR